MPYASDWRITCLWFPTLPSNSAGHGEALATMIILFPFKNSGRARLDLKTFSCTFKTRQNVACHRLMYPLGVMQPIGYFHSTSSNAIRFLDLIIRIIVKFFV